MEKTLARNQHSEFEELRLSKIRRRNGGVPELELRQWTISGEHIEPSNHGLRIPFEIVPWLIAELENLADETGSNQREETFTQEEK